MQSSRFMFEGKLVNMTVKESSRYAIGGVRVLFDEGRPDGLAMATNGSMLTVSPARRMTAKMDRLAEIVPRDAFPSFASTTVDRFTTEDGVRYATKGALLEPEEGVFPPIADIMDAALPEERIVVGINAKYLLDLAASLGDKNQRVALVINTARRNGKLGCAEGPILVTGTEPEHRGIGLLMPIAVSDVQVETAWTKMRASLKVMLEKVAGTKDPRGGSAFAKLARLSGWTPEQRWRRKNQRRLDREESRRVRNATTIPDGQGPAPLQVGERETQAAA